MASDSERNIEMARKGYQAFNEQHIDEAMEMIAGEYKGKQAVMEMFMKFGQLTEGTYEADLHDVLASDDHTVVIGTATSTRHGRTHSSRFVDIIHPGKDGKAKEFWRFVEDQAADDEFYNE